VDKGEMIEYGTFKQLMAKNGHMAKLVTENVQILREPEEFKPEIRRLSSTPATGLGPTGTGSRSFSHHQLTLPSIAEITDRKGSNSNIENLTKQQNFNRSRLSRLNSIIDTDENLAVLIEANQMLGQVQPTGSLIREIQRSRLSIVSAATSIEEITPSDAEPMKLVLEDQSVNYKLNPAVAYLKAGWGIIATLAIFVLFFLVHLVRILSGKFFFIKNFRNRDLNK
jgi:hypothetical protein